MDSYERINDVLVNLFRDVLDLEEKAMADTAFGDLSINDWHIIDVIGPEGKKNMSRIAGKLSVSQGSLTIAMNGLCGKGYAERSRGETDRRVVNVSLTEKGRTAYQAHEDFRKRMVESAISDLSPEELEALGNSLSKLTSFFMSFKEK